VACCGTKDASLGRSGSGQVSSTAIGVRLVNADGEVETITEAEDPEKMRAVRSSYGLVGVVFEITFRIERLSILSYSYKSFGLTPLPGLNELSGGADGVLGLLLPYSNRIVVERRVHSGTAPISRFSRLKHFLRGKLWENGVSFFATLLPYNWFFRIQDRLIGFFLVGISRLGGFRAHRSDSMIDFKFDRGHYFDFTFWAVPVSRWEDFIPEYVAFCRDYLRKTGFRVSLLSEVYFINKDQSALLSFSSEEDVFTVDLTDSRPNDPYWIEFNKRFNVFVARFGARPLLNQTKQLSRDIVYQTLGEDWKQFLLYREQIDPDGRFLSKFFEDLI
jgi:L-gulonolactone oxidase